MVRTPRVKLVPPRLPASHLRRPALERMLEEAERRRLTSIAAHAWRVNRSGKYFRRLIDRDAYDEAAHLSLVAALQAAGSHGEARRAYATYVSRMQEIGAEPVVFPAPALSRV